MISNNRGWNVIKFSVNGLNKTMDFLTFFKIFMTTPKSLKVTGSLGFFIPFGFGVAGVDHLGVMGGYEADEALSFQLLEGEAG